MKAVKVSPKKFTSVELKTLIKQAPRSEDGKLLIDEEAIIHENGKPIAIYKKYDEDLCTLLYACEAIRFSSYQRTGGLETLTCSIGHIPRHPTRTDACHASGILANNPTIHNIFVEHAEIVAKSYKKFFSDAYQDQLDNFIHGSKPVHNTYLIGDTAFTNGVINKNNALHYHFDKANTHNGISCMLMLANNISGGELVLPELNLRFACKDGFMLLFDGQKYLHGVTKIISASGGYRYTIVYYNNKGMKLCLPPDLELERFNELMTRKIN